jgi:hypothetical protein
VASHSTTTSTGRRIDHRVTTASTLSMIGTGAGRWNAGRREAVPHSFD